jgi:protein-S-isoprenylcysteine O-methyltransferase Ste14
MIVGTFLVAEGRLRRTPNAKSLIPHVTDAGTTARVGRRMGVMLALLLTAPLLTELAPTVAIHQVVIRWLAVGVAAVGLSVRVWAQQVLGQFYTRTLRVGLGQGVVDRGPYAVIRHPGYAGVLGMWGGAAVASGSLIALGAVLVLLVPAYVTRVRAEEAMLVNALGETYQRYRNRTWRLVPYLF